MRQGDKIVVEAITRVQSVDLVADPATTRSLFESAAQKAPGNSDILPVDQTRALTAGGPETGLSRVGRRTLPRTRLKSEQRLKAEVLRLTALDACIKSGKPCGDCCGNSIFLIQTAKIQRQNHSQRAVFGNVAGSGKRGSHPGIDRGAGPSGADFGRRGGGPKSAGIGEQSPQFGRPKAIGKNGGHGALFETLGKPCSRDQNIVLSPTETDVRSFVEAIT